MDNWEHIPDLDLDEDDLQQLYDEVSGELDDVDQRYHDGKGIPTGKTLKKMGLKYFNMKSLTDQYVNINDPDPQSLRNALFGENDSVMAQIRTMLVEYRFIGDIYETGSFRDGTKVKEINEFDCIFSVSLGKKTIERIDDDIGCRVYERNKREINAGEMRSMFADALDAIGGRLHLPERLTHGGFAGPENFSGVRINKPAVTLLFNWTPNNRRRAIQLSVDVIFAFELPYRLQSDIIEGGIDKIREIYGEDPDYRGKIHAVPVEDDRWNITSTLLESDMIRELPDVPIKKCIKLAKLTAYNRLVLPNSDRFPRKDHAPERVRIWQRSIEQKLQDYTAGRGGSSSLRQLRKLLRYGHIWLTPDICSEYDEMRRSPVSVISAAIKHLSIKQYLKLTRTERRKKFVEFDMLAEVLKQLGDLGRKNVRHWFLREDIKLISVAPYAGHDATALVREAKAECKKLGKRLLATKSIEMFKKLLKKQWRIIYILLACFIFQRFCLCSQF